MENKNIKKEVKRIIESNGDLYCSEKRDIAEVFEALSESDIKEFVVKHVGYSLEDAVDVLVDELSQYTNLDEWDLEKDIYDYIVDNDIYFIQLNDNDRFYIIQK